MVGDAIGASNSRFIANKKMSNFIDAVKEMGAGVGKAAGDVARELDRRRRIIGVQSEISDIKRQIDMFNVEIGKIVLNWYQTNAGDFASKVPTTLMPIPAQILNLLNDIQNKEAEIEQIKTEVDASGGGVPTPAGQVISPGPQAAPLIPAQPAAQVFVPAPAPVPAATPMQPDNFCMHCGKPKRQGSKFCPSCGKANS